MRILLSNDDGVRAKGIELLAEALSDYGEITVVAPDRDRSAASSSLTIDNVLRENRLENGFISINGTPTDCVHLGLTGLLDNKPELVVAGINFGSNLGDDVIYSGTVAAAIEGRLLGVPAIAISLSYKKDVKQQKIYFSTAAEVAKKLVAQFKKENLAKDTILNVNVPNIPISELKGIKITRLGHRHKSEDSTKTTDPRGREIFWIGPVGKEDDAGEGTDFWAVNNGYVSVTPLHTDLTNYSALESTNDWLS